MITKDKRLLGTVEGAMALAAVTGFGAAWEETFRYVVDHGLECADQPCYELYHDDCMGRTCRFDVCVPLKKK